MPINKKCYKCKELKSTSEFYANKAQRDGLTNYCKACKKILYASYAENNRDKISLYNKQYQENNRERIQQVKRNYIEKDGKRWQEYNKEYYEANKERIAESNKRWQEANKDKIKGQRLFAKYGITLEDYKSLLKQQNDLCCICKKKEKLFVDHCHKTGKVRGLLCNHCNTGIGKFYDNVNFLQNAINYINCNVNNEEGVKCQK